MSNAISGVGTQLKRGDGTSSETFTALAEVNSIQGPGMSRDAIDVTSLDSTGGYREYISGFRDGDDVSFNMNFTRANYDLMLADFDTDTVVNYQINFADTDNTIIAFSGFVTTFPSDITPDDKITMSVTIKVTGQPTVSSG